jgi:hypothetical protein
MGLSPAVETALAGALELARRTIATWRGVACGLLLFLALGWAVQPARAAATDGVVTLTLTTKTVGGKYAPRHVLAIWVADANTNFVKTLKRQAGDRSGYLYKWNTARAGYSVVDGVSGATLSTHTTHTVTWNCRDRNATVLNDGTYRFMVEFTEANSQGPWTTNSLAFTKGTTGFTNTLANQTAFTGISIRFTPATPAMPDLALLSIEPGTLLLGRPAAFSLVVSNKVATTATNVTVSLTNLATGDLIAARTLTTIAGNTAVTLTNLGWNIVDFTPGPYPVEGYITPATGEVVTSDNRLARDITLRHPRHDLAVTALGLPAAVFPTTPTNIAVTVENTGDYPESVDLAVRDLTDGRGLGTNRIASLAAAASNRVMFPWNPATATPGYHRIRAEAAAVAGETGLTDNSREVVVPVALGLQTNVFIAKGSRWRYHDRGLDLTLTPWKTPDYYDSFWDEGPAPLGYSDSGTHTNIVTKLSWGASTSAKQPTTYFRHSFAVDDPPLALTARIRRDDGFVLYFNGVEAQRDNLATNAITYSTWADTAISGTGQYTYNEFTPNAGLVTAGLNVAAVELHQQSATSSDIVLDVELAGVVPIIPKTHAIEAPVFAAARDVVAGDSLPLSVILTNRGTATENFTVFLRDPRSGIVAATRIVSALLPGATVNVDFTWPTLGLAPGDYGLDLYAVHGGATNRLGSTQATVRAATASPEPVKVAAGLGGNCTALAASSNWVVAVAGPNLIVFDRAHPLDLAPLASMRLPGSVQSVVLAGTLAYAACGRAGVQVVDLSQPSRPVQRSTVAAAGHATAVAVQGDLLAVADGRAGLRLFRMTDPAAPQLLGVAPTVGPAVAIALDASLGLLVDAQNGVSVLSLANPAVPAVRGTFKSIDAGRAAAVAGSIALIADNLARLHVLSLTNPAAPLRLAALALGQPGQAIALSGNRAYVAAGPGGLLTIDISQPAAPRLVATNATSDQTAGVAVNAGALYAAAGLAGLETYDLSQPANPRLVSILPAGFRVRDAAIRNGIACLACGEAGLQVFDVTDPVAPRWLGADLAATRADAVAVAGALAFVGNSGTGLRILDISNPRAPVWRGTYSSTNLPVIRRVAAAGNRVVLSDGYHVESVDVTSPSEPCLEAAGRIDGFAFGLACDGDRIAIAAGRQGLWVLTRNGTAFDVVARVATPGTATDVAFEGTRAWVAAGDRGWLQFDLTNPTAPVLLSGSNADGPVVALALAEQRLILTDGLNHARSLGVQVPLTPVPGDRFGPLVQALRVAAGGTLAMVAEDTEGAALLDLATGDRDNDGLPDTWEQQIVDADPADAFATIADVRPTEDFDGDGAANRDEYLAGTSPINPASTFVLAIAGNVPDAPVRLQWTSVAGRRYAVYRTDDLAAGFGLLEAGLAATPPINEFIDPAPGAKAYYLIAVQGQ